MKKSSWRFKLISLFMGILFISLFTQIFYIIPYIRNQEIEKTKIYQEEITNNIARELDVGLNRIKDRLQRMSIRPEFRNMDINAMQNILLEQEIISERISSIAVMNSEGQFVCGTMKNFSVYTKKTYADRPYFNIPFNEGKNYFSKPRYYNEKNLVSTSICIPIESESGDKIGVLIGGMKLTDTIQRVSLYHNEEGQTTSLIDKEGTVIAHSNTDLFSLEDGPLSLKTDCPMVQDIISIGKTESTIHKHGKKEYFGSYALLESNGWIVVSETPIKNILAQSSVLSQKILLFDLIFFTIALIITIIFARQITAEQKKTEDKIKKSEKKFRLLFSEMSEGVILHEIIYDKKGKAIDYRIIEMNMASDKILTIKSEVAIGKLSTEFYGTDKAPFLDIYAKVAETGKQYEFEQYFPPMKKHLHISVYCPEKGKFATVFSDITERKEAEAELAKHREHLEELVKERTEELEEKNKKLEKFNDLFVNREFRIKELKDKVKELERKNE